MQFQRDRYLNKLIQRMNNGQVKVVTGIRRCGKSYLLFTLFADYLKKNGVDDEHIIEVALDEALNEHLRDPHELALYLRDRIKPDGQYYILLDEIQYAISREEMRNPDKPVRLYGVLNGLLRLRNVDVYVTGSNSKMLSHDVMTEFRGRGDTVDVHPLSFAEYYGWRGGDKSDAYEEYALFGGMPFVWSKATDEDKSDYLKSLFQEVYYKDIMERYELEHPDVLDELTDVLCSSIGSLTNASKLSDTLNSVKQLKVNHTTIGTYLRCLTDSFLFRCAKRYDVKGKKYFEFPMKYYCEDVGLRNARLNYRQQEETHIMENIIYNELVMRGYSVDVGVVPVTELGSDGKRHQKTCEIDFVVNKGMKRYYVQSALNISDADKLKQEKRPLLAVRDSFQQIIVSKTNAKSWFDDAGIKHIGLYDFLLDEESLSR